MKRAESIRTLTIGPWRKIVSREEYRGVNMPHGGRGVLLTLECGHTERRKASKAPKSDRARCGSCRQRIGA